MGAIKHMISAMNASDGADETDARLLRFVLGNIQTIGSYTVQDIADKTFVSKATVTRFVRKHGFSDFEDFKRQAIDFAHEDIRSALRMNDRQLAQIKREPEAFLSSYAESIANAVCNTAEHLETGFVDRLIQRMALHHTALFAFDQTLLCAQEIQKDFLRKGRILEVGSTHALQLQIAKGLDPNSFALVLSSYGNYFDTHRDILDALRERAVPTTLVTCSYSGPLLVNFEEVLTLTPQGFSDAGGYPMRLFSEFLVRRLAVTAL